LRHSSTRSLGQRRAGGLIAAVLLVTSVAVLAVGGVAGAALDPTGAGMVCEDPPVMEPFTDVGDTDPANAEIECLLGLDITTGVTATTYEPNSPVTRRQMVLFLARFAGVVESSAVGGEVTDLPVGDGVAPFTDVTDSDIAHEEVDALEEAGIVQGFEDGSFGPNRVVTRRQMAKFIVRIQETMAGADVLPSDVPDAFADDNGDSGEEELNVLAAEGVFEGDSSGDVNPGDDISRRQMAFVLTRKLQYLQDEAVVGEVFPGLVVTGAPTTTTEAGGTDSFTVALATSPSSAVTVNVSSVDAGEATVDLSSLVFTTADWDQPQTVTVTGVDEALDDGDVTHDITLEVDTGASADEYDGLGATVSNTNVDDDESPELGSVGPGTAVEGNAVTATFTLEVTCPSVDAADWEVHVDGNERTVDGVDCESPNDASVIVYYGGPEPVSGDEVELKLIGKVTDWANNEAPLSSMSFTV
jgi:hypothetical protein